MIFRLLFGKDKSSEFVSLLPTISKRVLLFNVLKIVLFSILISAIFGGITLAVFNFIDSPLDEFASGLVFMIFVYLSVIFFSYKYFYQLQSVLKKQLSSLPFRTVARHVTLIIITMFLISYLVNIVEFIIDPISMNPILSYFNGVNSSDGNSITYVSLMLLPILWLLVGVGEELFFRGGIYRVLRYHFSSNIALILMSVFFVLPHHWSFTNSVSIFVFAMLWGRYFEYKNNILVLIIVHMFQDLLVAGFSVYLAAVTVNLFIN